MDNDGGERIRRFDFRLVPVFSVIEFSHAARNAYPKACLRSKGLALR